MGAIRQSVAQISLYSAWALVVLGGMALCTCPLFPAIGLGFALISVLLSRGRGRLVPLLAMLVSGYLTVSETRRLMRQQEAKAEAIQRRSATNSAPGGPNTVTNRSR